MSMKNDPVPARPGGVPDLSGERAADTIVRDLEQRIATGEFKDGSPLPSERELIALYGSSRTVIREAITILTNRGFVQNRPRYRPIVRKPGYDSALDAISGIVSHLLNSPSGVRNLYDSRIFLERALVREAALSARKDDIARLDRALDANHEALPDSEAFYGTDVAFHGVLYRIPGNPIFPAIHDAFTAWLAPHWIKMPRSPERNLVNFQSHKAIFSAIIDRDPDGAEDALINHLRAAWEYVRVTFDPESS